VHEFRADDPLEFGDQPFFDSLVKKGEILLLGLALITDVG
jgi:hypothetical protein